MLAISSLSRNSRYVGAMWVGLFLVSEVASSVLDQTIHRDWCPLLSYTANLSRVQDALLDSETARKQLIVALSGRSGPASPGGPAAALRTSATRGRFVSTGPGTAPAPSGSSGCRRAAGE